MSKETTSSVSLGKRSTVWAALKLIPSLSVLRSMVSFSPIAISELGGAKKSVAASATEENARTSNPIKTAANKSLIFIFFIFLYFSQKY